MAASSSDSENSRHKAIILRTRRVTRCRTPLRATHAHAACAFAGKIAWHRRKQRRQQHGISEDVGSVSMGGDIGGKSGRNISASAASAKSGMRRTRTRTLPLLRHRICTPGAHILYRCCYCTAHTPHCACARRTHGSAQRVNKHVSA